MKTRRMTLKFPTGGVNKRTSYQDQPPYTAYAASNVWPDNVADGRERGGTRPGLTTAITGTLPGPIRMMHEINVPTTDGTESVLVCSSNGGFYRRNSSNAWVNISSSFSLATDRFIQAASFGSKLYIADWGIDDSGTTLVVDDDSNTVVHLPEVTDSNNGACNAAGTTFFDNVAGSNDGLSNGTTTFNSAGSDFDAAGVTPGTHVLRITTTGSGTGAAVVGVYEIVTKTDANNLVLGSAIPADSAITFEVNVDQAAAGVTTSHLLRVKNDGDGNAAVLGVYAISAIDQDYLTVADMNGAGGAETGISYETRPAFSYGDITSNNHGLEVLEAGNGTAGFYAITAAAPDQLTLSSSPGASSPQTTGIHFRVHRTPKVWDLSDNSITKWETTAGDLPLSCKLICYYQDRLFLAGAPSDPQNWFACKQGDPTDFAYAQNTVESAVAGNNYNNGEIGDPITALIPHNRQCLVIGAEDSLYVLRGDPNSPSSVIDQLSDFLGPISPQAWCKDAQYRTWMLTRDGICIMPNGCGDTPQSFSREKIPNDLLNMDVDNYDPLLQYDLLQRAVVVAGTMKTAAANGDDGVLTSSSFTSASFSSWENTGIEVGDYIWIPAGTSRLVDGMPTTVLSDSYMEITNISGGTLTVDTSSSPATTITELDFKVVRTQGDDNRNYWIDTDRGGIWPMDWPDDCQPSALRAYPKLTTQYKSAVIYGSVNGVAYQPDRQVTTDAGYQINSNVTIGPFRVSRDSFSRSIITSAKMIPTENSGDISWEVRAAATAEAAAKDLVGVTAPNAKNYDDLNSGEYSWEAPGYLQVQHPRVAGAAGAIYISSSVGSSWSIEHIELEIAEAGRLR